MTTKDDQLRADAKALFDNYMENRNMEIAKVKPFEFQFENLVKKYLKK